MEEEAEGECERELKARRVILVRQNIGESVNDDMIEIMMINMVISHSQLFGVVIAQANILNNLFSSLFFRWCWMWRECFLIMLICKQPHE